MKSKVLIMYNINASILHRSSLICDQLTANEEISTDKHISWSSQFSRRVHGDLDHFFSDQTTCTDRLLPPHIHISTGSASPHGSVHTIKLTTESYFKKNTQDLLRDQEPGDVPRSSDRWSRGEGRHAIDHVFVVADAS
jgi:hypothetical protein